MWRGGELVFRPFVRFTGDKHLDREREREENIDIFFALTFVSIGGQKKKRDVLAAVRPSADLLFECLRPSLRFRRQRLSLSAEVQKLLRFQLAVERQRMAEQAKSSRFVHPGSVLVLSPSRFSPSTRSVVFALRRVPTFCRSIPQWLSETKFECSRSETFGLVVHGLWPQSSTAKSIRGQPRNCFNDEQLSLNVIRRYYCLMPDEYLMQAEWEKHGSCFFGTAVEYFDRIETLFNRLTLPNLRGMKSAGRTAIRSEFLRLNPQLPSSALQIFVNEQNELEEIRLCYDLQFRYRSC